MINKKIIILIILFITIISCNENNSSSKLHKYLIGNWYYVGENLNYQEFYFDGDKMHKYLDSSGDFYSYEYYIKSDSIYYYCIPNMDINKDCDTLFGLVSKQSSKSIKINNITLNKFSNKNDIESYLKGEIILDTLDKHVAIRKKQFINYKDIDKTAYEIDN